MSALLQAEADSLRTMSKRLTTEAKLAFGMPSAGEIRTFELESMDKRFGFLLDINRRGKIKLTRCTLNERYRVTDFLARLDIDGAPHVNPTVDNAPLPSLAPYNGRKIECPHLHFYVEGFDDRWAIPAANEGFSNTDDLVATLRQFMNYCGIEQVSEIQSPMF